MPLELTGSKACEQFLSKVGGMRGREQIYDLAELVECATNVNRLAAMDLVEGMMGARKSHKVFQHLHESSINSKGNLVYPDQTDYT